MSYRRWIPTFRFSLRALLIVIALVAIWLGIKFDQARKQKAAAERVRAIGGTFCYDFEWDQAKETRIPNASSPVPRWLLGIAGQDFFHDVVQVDLGTGKVSEPLNPEKYPDECSTFLPGLPELRTLLLFNARVSDESLELIGQLQKLELLMMWDAGLVTDAGIDKLRNLPRLKYIHCSNSHLTDESLRTFGSMPKFEGLSLQGNRFTDAGLAYLKDLHQLKNLWIDLGETHITDEGLRHLEGLKNLTELGIQSQPNVTPDGVAKLKAAIPGLKSVCQ